VNVRYLACGGLSLPRSRQTATFTVAAAVGVAPRNFAPFAIVFTTPSQACFARVMFAAKHTLLDVDDVR
jgi:hypothetical protein